jgi:multicomponent K+:H+ antiporter subunit D
MNHLVIAPVLLPMFAGGMLLFAYWLPLKMQRLISLAAIGALAIVAMALVNVAAQDAHVVYRLGGWAPPFGIVLVLDRLSALMLLATALLALFAGAYATRRADAEGPHFHMLFQFQLMGLNGAFLTGDLFNLFVCFEILLIASYALLMHGAGKLRSRAGIHYVVLNLVGSALFLMGVGTLYGITGTLNMADLSVAVAQVAPQDQPLVHAAALLLLVVFTLKAALLPVLFWLPTAYSSASAPVAALFAIMTKVGVYAIMRVHVLIFGPDAGDLSGLAWDWLAPLALTTLAFGTLGILAAGTLRRLAAYQVIASSGILLSTVALATPAALSAALFYLLHTTWISAALFLLADLIAGRRGDHEDRLVSGPALHQSALLGGLFLLVAMTGAGLPPFSGFLAKLLILQAAHETALMAWLWSFVLTAALLTLIALSRAGSVLFWRTSEEPPTTTRSVHRTSLTASGGLLALGIGLAVLAAPVTRYTEAAAAQLFDTAAYVAAVLGPDYPAGATP